MDASVPKKSRFSIPDHEVKILLQRKDLVGAQVYHPVYANSVIGTDKFVRQVNIGKNIGVDQAGVKTSIITILTDKKGNLINVFPGILQ